MGLKVRYFFNSASLPSHNRYPADADCLINKINEIRRSGRDNNSQFRWFYTFQRSFACWFPYFCQFWKFLVKCFSARAGSKILSTICFCLRKHVWKYDNSLWVKTKCFVLTLFYFHSEPCRLSGLLWTIIFKSSCPNSVLYT